MKNNNLSHLIWGLVIGILLPWIAVYVIFSIKNEMYSFETFFRVSFLSGMLAKQLSIGTLLNLAFFMFAIGLKKDALARGFLIATLLIGALIIYLKLT